MMDTVEEQAGSVLDFSPIPELQLPTIEQLCKEYDLEKAPLFIAAPMVRYSNLPFRRIVKEYGADILYTPMIQANSLMQSYRNRTIQWGWHLGDDYPIVQLAASNGKDFADAAELCMKWTSGVDLNCGCPKQNVRKMGCGSILLKDPESIADMVKQARARIPQNDFTISVKLRILNTAEQTVEMCRILEHAGVQRIGLHVRTVESGGTGPTVPEFASAVKAAIKIPLYVNGGVKTIREAFELAKVTNADGVMVAAGLLHNPALFAGYERTPLKCIRKFVEEAILEGMNLDFLHQHLVFMTRYILGKRERQNLNNCASVPHILDFLERLEIC